MESETDPYGAVTSADYPIDDFSLNLRNSDPDNDGTDETLMIHVFYEFSDNTIRSYEKWDVTDGGSDTATLAEIGRIDKFFYDSSYDVPYTLVENTVVTENYSETYHISGDSLTLSFTDDNNTPYNTSDDTTKALILSIASKSDVASAVDEFKP